MFKLHRKNSVNKRNFSLRLFNNIYSPYTLSIENVGEMFFNYRFISKIEFLKNRKVSDKLSHINLIKSLISKNLAYAEQIKNSSHLIYWNELKFLVESKIFDSIFSKENIYIRQ